MKRFFLSLFAIALLAIPANAATLTPQSIMEAGIVPTFAAASAGGDVFLNPSDQRLFLVVTNGSGSSITVTITAQTASKNVPGLGTVTKANAGGAVAASATKYFGPFPAEAFNNTSGQVAVTYSSATTVTVAVLRLPKR